MYKFFLNLFATSGIIFLIISIIYLLMKSLGEQTIIDIRYAGSTAFVSIVVYIVMWICENAGE